MRFQIWENLWIIVQLSEKGMKFNELKAFGKIAFFLNKQSFLLLLFVFLQDFLSSWFLGGGEFSSLSCYLLPTVLDFYKICVPNDEPMSQMRSFGNGLSRQHWERGWRQIAQCICPLKYGSFASRFHAGISGKVTFFLPSLLPFVWPNCH